MTSYATDKAIENLTSNARSWRALASDLARSGDVEGSRLAEICARDCEAQIRDLERPIVVPRPFRAT